MTYQKITILNEFINEEHKKLYYDNLYRILGINDINLINKLINGWNHTNRQYR
jgi:hypothetical protein